MSHTAVQPCMGEDLECDTIICYVGLIPSKPGGGGDFDTGRVDPLVESIVQPCMHGGCDI
jgi:hypothetical protein